MTQFLALIIAMIATANAPIEGFWWNALVFIGAFQVADLAIEFTVAFLQAVSAAFLKATTKESE